LSLTVVGSGFVAPSEPEWRNRMTNMTDDRMQTEQQSGMEQVKDKVGEAADQAKGKTREQLRSQIDERSTMAGDQVTSTANALRRASEQLRTEGNERMANVIDAFADRSQRFGGYLTNADGDRMLNDAERYMRKQPWLMAGAGALAGFLASRFVKATSTNRYRSAYMPDGSLYASGYSTGGYPSRGLSDGGAATSGVGARGGGFGGVD